jgi:hypothetical protein
MRKKLALLVFALAAAAAAGRSIPAAATLVCSTDPCPPKSHRFCCPTGSFCCPDNALCACIRIPS